MASRDTYTPHTYDVMACLQKYDVGTFDDFCDAYGYDSDSMKAFDTYHAVCNEYKKMASLFTPTELEKLGDIE